MTLRKYVAEGRQLLEGNTARKPLLDTANEWRKFIRLGDRFLEAVSLVLEATERASAAKYDLDLRRANADVSSAMRRVVGVTGPAYEHFRNGRISLYEVATIYQLPTHRPAPKWGKKPVPLAKRPDAELRKQMLKSGAGLAKGIREMLDLGARSSKEFRMAAKINEMMPPELAASLLSRGLDFRDSVSVNVFARSNGVMRRAAELGRRAWEQMMMEDSKLGWEAPWAHDSEIGDLEA